MHSQTRFNFLLCLRGTDFSCQDKCSNHDDVKVFSCAAPLHPFEVFLPSKIELNINLSNKVYFHSLLQWVFNKPLLKQATETLEFTGSLIFPFSLVIKILLCTVSTAVDSPREWGAATSRIATSASTSSQQLLSLSTNSSLTGGNDSPAQSPVTLLSSGLFKLSLATVQLVVVKSWV